MLPATVRYWLFDAMSVQPMRYVSAVPGRRATGLTRDVYRMIREDFFRNGSLTSRSKVPELMAAIWTGGRETMLVPDKVDRTTKDAMAAVLSQKNSCPYCGDMLISLVHAGGDHGAAKDIRVGSAFDNADEILRKRLEWTAAIASGGDVEIPMTPFDDEQLPEVLGSLMGMSDINRFSHVVMEDSPVKAPFGLDWVKSWALRLFGKELEVTRRVELLPGRALALLPQATLPEDMRWAKSNPRIADAVARWVATVELEGAKVISPRVREAVQASLDAWSGESMPLDGSWIDTDVEGLHGEERAIARLAIVLGKASYRITDDMVQEVLGESRDEQRFIRILAWASFSGARRFTQVVAQRIAEERAVGAHALAA